MHCASVSLAQASQDVAQDKKKQILSHAGTHPCSHFSIFTCTVANQNQTSCDQCACHMHIMHHPSATTGKCMMPFAMWCPHQTATPHFQQQDLLLSAPELLCAVTCLQDFRLWSPHSATGVTVQVSLSPSNSPPCLVFGLLWCVCLVPT